MIMLFVPIISLLYLLNLNNSLIPRKTVLKIWQGKLWSKPSWINRPDEEEVIVKSSEIPYLKGDRTLFDSLLAEASDQTDTYSISKMSLNDIAESYGFSLAYLGDFVIQMGCPPPLDVNTAISNYMIGDQVYTLLEAITTMDTFEVNEGYDSITVGDLADELDLSVPQMVRLCKKEQFNLPFGFDTTLHYTVATRIRELIEMGEYSEDFIEAETTPITDIAEEAEEQSPHPTGLSDNTGNFFSLQDDQKI